MRVRCQTRTNRDGDDQFNSFTRIEEAMFRGGKGNATVNDLENKVRIERKPISYKGQVRLQLSAPKKKQGKQTNL